MRSNRNDSECGAGNCNGSNASATSVNGGHGRLCAGGDGDGREEAKENESWFEPIDTTSECPGGICPVPWATQDQEVFDEQQLVLSNTVNHPLHYTDGEIECIEAIEAQLTPEEYRGYLKGNVAKYVWREKHKGGIESLKKAQWYLNRLINLE
jgi:hypothetical protein